MTDPTRTVRIPDHLWERADRMAEHLADDPELSLHGKVTRSVVLRLALARGLASLEDQYGTPAPAEPAPAAKRKTRASAKPKGKGKR